MLKRQRVLKTKFKPDILAQTFVNKAKQVQHPLHKLQQQCGNHSVQRFVGMSKRNEDRADVAPELERIIQQKRGSGQSLDRGIRQQMEPALGADFGDVRVHTDAESNKLNRILRSRAFATGKDIFFGNGLYKPGNASGRELIAHELTHVVQQSRGQVQRKMEVSRPGDRFENEANEVASKIMQREQNAVQQNTATNIAHRQQEEEEKGIAQKQPEEEEGENAVQTQPEQEEDESVQAQLQDPALQRQSAEEDEQTTS